jgi:hypothetical protein
MSKWGHTTSQPYLPFPEKTQRRPLLFFSLSSLFSFYSSVVLSFYLLRFSGSLFFAVCHPRSFYATMHPCSHAIMLLLVSWFLILWSFFYGFFSRSAVRGQRSYRASMQPCNHASSCFLVLNSLVFLLWFFLAVCRPWSAVLSCIHAAMQSCFFLFLGS